MKRKSTARKFKLITGKDFFQAQKELEKASKGTGEGMTEITEFVQFGLHLAFYSEDLAKAKRDFSDFMESGEFDDVEPLTKLVEKFTKEFKG